MDNTIEPRVAFVLVNYNTEVDTVECVDSINEKLTYNNYEIIIVDNSSEQGSFYTIQKAALKNTLLIKSEKNGGFAAGCNLGILQAKRDGSDYIILLNNDTIIKSNDLVEQLLKCFQDESVGMAGGKILYYDSPDEVWYAAGYISKIRLRAKNRINIKEICETEFITGCLQMISMKVLEEVGLLNEDYFLCYEDTDYCKRLHMHGYKTIYNPNAQIYHKVSKSAPSASPVSIYNSNRARYIYLKRYHKNSVLIKMAYWIELFLKIVFYRNEKKEAICKTYRKIRRLDY